MELLVIPNELLIRILFELDVPSLVRCATACRHIYDTFKTSLDLTYTTEAYINGVVYAGLLSAVPYPERLTYLHRQRREWMSSKWTKILSVYLMHSGYTYDIAGRVFAQCNGNVLDVVTLPSSSISRKSERITFNLADDDTNAEVCPEYLGIDPSQDLIVLIKDVDTETPPVGQEQVLSIFLRTLSTNEPHPKARLSSLEFNRDDDPVNLHNAVITIVKNILMLQFQSEDGALRAIIWDWTTAELVLNMSGEANPLVLPSNSALGLLNTSLFFVASTSGDGAICLYELFHPLPVLLATLHLPGLCAGVKPSAIYAQAGPIETQPLADSLFMLNKDDRLHVITLDYYDPDLPVEKRKAIAVSFYIHQRVFSKYCIRNGRDGIPFDISWEKWGPLNTKIVFLAHPHSEWPRPIHGQRALCSVASYDGRKRGNAKQFLARPSSICLLDFSLSSVLVARGSRALIPELAREKNETLQGIKLEESSLILASKVHLFRDDVETRLPCISIKPNFQKKYTSYNVYADGLLCISENEADGSRRLDIPLRI